MLCKMSGPAAHLLLTAILIIITIFTLDDVAAESDMMTLEEYRRFMAKQAVKNKHAYPKKVWTVSEKSLYDDLGDGPGVIGDEVGGNNRGSNGNKKLLQSEMLVDLRRFHRDGQVFDKPRYRRSLEPKPDDVYEDQPEDENNLDKVGHLGDQGRHLGGAQDRKYLPDSSGQIHVVSSAIRILPPNKDHRMARIMNLGVEKEKIKENGTAVEGKVEDDSHRQKRNEYHWRRPKTQFVTGTYRMTPPSSRFQLPAFPTQARNNRRYLHDNEVSPFSRRSSTSSQRRIIYYATLPEIVRPPTTNEWQRHHTLSGATAHGQTSPHHLPTSPVHPHASPLHQHSTRQAATNHDSRPQPQYNPNPPPSDNEIIHVQSAVIDVTNNRDQPSLPSQQPPPTAILTSSAITSIPQQKYTIYDMEPPYMRQPYYNNYYNFDNKLSGYNKQGYSYYHQQYQPLGGPQALGGPQSYPNYYQNRFYGDIRTPPYRVQTPYHSDLPPYHNSLPPYQNPYQSPPLYYRKPEYVPVEVQTTVPTTVSSSTTTSTTPATNGVGDPRHQTSSTAGTGVGGELNQDKGNSTNNLVSRYV